MGSITTNTEPTAQSEMMYPAPLEANRDAGLSATTNGDSTIDIETPVLIVGGGPVGMLQSLMLARLHKIKSVLIEREPTTTTFPKMEYTNGRSMEIYRMMGLAKDFRAMANQYVPDSASFTELNVTSLVDNANGGPKAKMIHPWIRPSVDDMRAESRKVNDGSKYLEPHTRCHQIPVEAWLRRKIEELPELIEGHWGYKFVGLEEREDDVVAEIVTDGGRTLRIKAQYVIGTDGGGSFVRKSVGLESKRNYLSVIPKKCWRCSHSGAAGTDKSQGHDCGIRPYPIKGSTRSHEQVPTILAHQHRWRRSRRFPERGRSIHLSKLPIPYIHNIRTPRLCKPLTTPTQHLVLPPGGDATHMTPNELVDATIGGCNGPQPMAIDKFFCRGQWKVDVAIATSFRSAKGRVFLAGDSAHQLSPIGGHGLNSGLADAFDLAWKLSAVMKGWAGEGLLATYDTDRRAIAHKNMDTVHFALANWAGKVWLEPVGKYGLELLAADTPEGEDARRGAAEGMAPAQWIHNQNGNMLGYQYLDKGTVIVEQEKGERPISDLDVYLPTTYPGSRLPHVWTKKGTSTLDLLKGDSFTLLDFSAEGVAGKLFDEAAKEVSVPLQVVRLYGEDHVKKIYEREVILVRPDMHVSWRTEEGVEAGGMSAEEARTILKKVACRQLLSRCFESISSHVRDC
jgi:2-polyprenyl-6-methoxyphenol hydroxylase-like FAD-dependent oxidoreductase